MKLKGVKLLSIGLFLFGLVACKEEPIILDYCKMISEDQSYVNTDKSDMVKFNADKKERHKIFKKNFELIIRKTKQAGFPYVSLNSVCPFSLNCAQAVGFQLYASTIL